MNYRIFLTFMIMTCSHAFAIDNSSNIRAIIIEKYTVTALKDNNDAFTFSPGEFVTIKKTNNDNVLVESVSRGAGSVWIPRKLIVTKNSFKKLDKWTGEKHVEFESPDLWVEYTIDSVGGARFKIHSTNGSSNLIRGHLYISKNVIWIRADKDDEILGQNIFLILPNGKLCSPDSDCNSP